ncbi:MAG: bifunctional nuclease family protein [Chloroflexia bacterium]
MVEAVVRSVHVSLITQHRLVVLKERRGKRYLPIWISPDVADAIALEMQGVQMARPFTHDLLRSVIETLGAKVSRILVNDIRDNTFYARIIFDMAGRYLEVDSRPSDAIALAVRVKCPIYIEESVLEQAGLTMEEEEEGTPAPAEQQDLDVFREFLSQLEIEEPPEEGPEEDAGIPPEETL